METQFTKGPWSHDDCGIVDSDTVLVCDTYVTGSEGYANANLIASAPEMYEMLERLKKECQIFYDEFGEPSNPDYEAAFVEIDNLLSKARGEHE